jgi:hypothetical protein
MAFEFFTDDSIKVRHHQIEKDQAKFFYHHRRRSSILGADRKPSQQRGGICRALSSGDP